MLLFLTKKIFNNVIIYKHVYCKYTIKFVIYALISAFIILPPMH